MKSRIIQTRFWDDEFVCNASTTARYVFIYLLTCQYINICGTFQLADKKIAFETGVDIRVLPKIKKELQDAKKVFFIDGWVHVCNARRNNQYEKSGLNQIACSNELDKVPQKVKDSINLYLNSSIDTSMDSSMYTTQKQEIRNNNINNNNINTDKEENIKEESVVEAVVLKDDEVIFHQYLTSFSINPTLYKFTDARRQKVLTRLKDFKVDQICKAIENASKDDFYRGSNNRGWKADLEYICRSYEITEKLINLQPRRNSDGKPHIAVMPGSS